MFLASFSAWISDQPEEPKALSSAKSWAGRYQSGLGYLTKLTNTIREPMFRDMDQVRDPPTNLSKDRQIRYQHLQELGGIEALWLVRKAIMGNQVCNPDANDDLYWSYANWLQWNVKAKGGLDFYLGTHHMMD